MKKGNIYSRFLLHETYKHDKDKHSEFYIYLLQCLQYYKTYYATLCNIKKRRNVFCILYIDF